MINIWGQKLKRKNSESQIPLTTALPDPSVPPGAKSDVSLPKSGERRGYQKHYMGFLFVQCAGLLLLKFIFMN